MKGDVKAWFLSGQSQRAANRFLLVQYIFLALALAMAVFVLSGCATQGQPITGQSLAYRGAMHADGTLSDSNDEIDGLASAVYTRLAGYRRNAAFLLRNGRISVSEAKYCQNTADGIRRQLDTAYKMRDRRKIETLRARILTAVRALERR